MALVSLDNLIHELLLLLLTVMVTIVLGLLILCVLMYHLMDNMTPENELCHQDTNPLSVLRDTIHYNRYDSLSSSSSHGRIRNPSSFPLAITAFSMVAFGIHLHSL